MEITHEIKHTFQQGSIVTRLIIINIAIFLVQIILSLIGLDFISTWLNMPSNPFSFIVRPWTLISYQFLHADPMHILFNMLWLYWFGQMFLHFFTQRQLLSLYLLGGIFGGLLFLITYNALPMLRAQDALLLGASASVTAIGVAVAAYRPNIPVNMILIGEIKLKWVVIFMIFLDLYNISNGQNAGGHFSHLGGAIFGFFYGKEMLRGHDISRGFTRLLDWVLSVFNTRRRGPKLRQPINDRERDFQHNALKRVNQAEIDAILDKISRSGYESLTHEEKQKLFRAGQ